MKIVSYNIRYGGLGREGGIIDVLESTTADLIILIEAIEPTVVRHIQERLDMPFGGCVKSYSVAFLSKLKPINYHWHEEKGIHTPFLELEFDQLRVWGVHLSALLTRWRENQRKQEIELLLYAVKSSKADNHLLIGDFNCIAGGDSPNIANMPVWLQILIRLSGGIQTYALVRLTASDYVDLYRHFHQNASGFTLPTPQPNSRLDYAFASTALIDHVESCNVVRYPEAVDSASDHYPISIELDF